MTTLTANLTRLIGGHAKNAQLIIEAPSVNDVAGHQLYSGGGLVPFADGRLSVELLPTDTPGTDPATWQYGLTVVWDGGALPTIWTDLTGATVDLSSLQNMGETDPVYLPPADVAAARLETFQARDVAEAARAAAAASEANAGGHAFVAGQAYAGALEQRQQAEAAAQAALAQNFGGALLGTAHLDTITTPGIGRQPTAASATTANGYPRDNIPGVLEVLRTDPSGTGMMQRYTATWPTPNTWIGCVWIRTRQATGSAWTGWVQQGLVVDVTAGRAGYMRDYVNGRSQLVYGDTGWRDITALLANGWTAAFAYLRRTMHTVELQLLSPVAGTATTVYTLPSGFVPRGGISLMLRPTSGTSPPVYGSVGSNGDVGLPLGSTPASGGHSFTWTTTQNWPASLPGTPSGQPPNL